MNIKALQFSILFSLLMCSNLLVYGQKQTISGTVTDSQSGKTLPAVNIVEKGTASGTSTDGKGNFKLEVSSLQDTLVFSYIGYQTRQIPIGGRTKINVTLSSQAITGEEVVVVGYGTQQKKDVTGSVASVSSEDLETSSITSLDQAIAGKLPGVQVQQTSGKPGSSSRIRIRGTASITAGNDPLVVIDGFPGGSLSELNPKDIKSVQVLKDASATAIYGSRGANGVIMVTTKKGREGEMEVNLNVNYGVQNLSKKLDLLNTKQWLQAFAEARDYGWSLSGPGRNTDDPNSVREPKYIVPDSMRSAGNFSSTDWQDAIYDPAPFTNEQLSISGGSSNINYYVSTNYTHQEGLMMTTGFKRYSLRANLQANISDKLDMGLNFAPQYSEQKNSATGSRYAAAWNAITQMPIYPIYNADGTFSHASNDPPAQYDLSLWDTINPVMQLAGTENNQTNTRLFANGYLNYQITKALSIKGNFGARLNDNRSDFFQKDYVDESQVRAPLPPNGNSATNNIRNLLAEFTIHYKKTFSDEHHLKVLAGYTAQEQQIHSNNLHAVNYITNAVPTLNVGQVSTGGSNFNEWALLSYLARINYNFDERYLVTVTFRRDGSSRFGSDNRWGNFPSAAVGWIFTNESFLESLSGALSYGKIRASYGLTGNDQIGTYPSYAQVYGGTGYSNKYFFGTSKTLNSGIRPASLPNNQLGWEQTAQADIGVELGFLEDRFTFEFDYYNSKTKDLLLSVPLPSSSGYNTYTKNIGKVRNRGLELSLTSNNIRGVFNWTTSINFSRNRNKVLALGPNDSPIKTGGNNLSNTNITMVGKPIGSFYGYKFDGVFKSEEEINNALEGANAHLGYPKVKDVNNDGVINSDDRTILGNNQPDLIYGITNTLSYKGLSLYVDANGTLGNEIFNAVANEANSPAASRELTGRVRNRYQSPDHPGNGIPIFSKYNRKFISNGLANSLYIEDGSFFRIRDLKLSYELHSTFFNNFPIGSARVYVNAHNLLTITNYRGYDPEIDSQLNQLSPGIDYGAYPTARTFTVGLNLRF